MKKIWTTIITIAVVILAAMGTAAAAEAPVEINHDPSAIVLSNSIPIVGQASSWCQLERTYEYFNYAIIDAVTCSTSATAAVNTQNAGVNATPERVSQRTRAVDRHRQKANIRGFNL